MKSPGVRADYEQSLSRLQQLEASMNPDDHETAMSLGVYGSLQWWEAKSDPERQSALLMLVHQAVVDPMRPLAKDGGPDDMVDVSWH